MLMKFNVCESNWGVNIDKRWFENSGRSFVNLSEELRFSQIIDFFTDPD